MNDIEMEGLSQALKTTTSLQSFHIEFQSQQFSLEKRIYLLIYRFGEGVTDIGMLQLCEALGSLSGLKKLTFDFDP